MEIKDHFFLETPRLKDIIAKWCFKVASTKPTILANTGKRKDSSLVSSTIQFVHPCVVNIEESVSDISTTFLKLFGNIAKDGGIWLLLKNVVM